MSLEGLSLFEEDPDTPVLGCKNPWSVESVDVFLFYCCPQCDLKCQSKDVFLNHAYINHPESQQTVKVEPSMMIKEEIEAEALGCDIKVKVELPETTGSGKCYDYVFDPFGEDNGDRHFPMAKKKRKRRSDAKPRDEDMTVVQCYKCGQMEDTMEAMKVHQEENHKHFVRNTCGEPRQVQCENCKRMFHSEYAHTKHLPSCRETKKVRNNAEKTCNLCERFFQGKQSYLIHMSSVHGAEKPYACDQCDFKAAIPLLLKSHKKKKHSGQRQKWMCELCGKSFLEHHLYTHHKGQEHGEGSFSFVCHKCGETFNSKMSLSLHNSNKHRIYKVCTLCDKLCANTRKLKEHYVTAHQFVCKQKALLVCMICKEESLSLDDLENHIKDVHREKVMLMPDLFRCSKCDKTFSQKVLLKVHLMEAHEFNPTRDKNTREAKEVFDIISAHRVHAKVGTYPCNLCHKTFCYQRTLTEHTKQVHDKRNHIKCSMCEYSSYQPNMVSKHFSRVHDKSNPIQCELCDAVFYHQHAMRNHLRQRHSEVRRYPCPNCDKRFNSKTHLTTHLLVEHGQVVC